MKYETNIIKILSNSITSNNGFYNSQMVTVKGIVKDSLGTNGIAISVNDTVRKFRDKAFKDPNIG